MPRVKGGTIHRARRKKVMKEAKGYFGSKHRLYKSAKEQVMHSGKYAYRYRRQKKRDFRKLWITRINAACRENEISYSKFINGLSKAGVTVAKKTTVKETKTEKVETVKDETKDLSKLTVAELKEMAKKKGIEGISTMKKADLLEALK